VNADPALVIALPVSSLPLCPPPLAVSHSFVAQVRTNLASIPANSWTGGRPNPPEFEDPTFE
jgi:hypothetical protein